MFKSERLVFNSLTLDDAEFTFGLRNGNYEFSKNLIISVLPTSLAKEKEWILKLYDDKTKVYFAIRMQSNLQIIGYCFLTEIDYVHRHANVGIIIAEDFNGNGFGAESIEFISKYGFCGLGLNKLHANVLCGNLASQKIFEKNGFLKEGCLKKEYFISGSWEDCIVYSKFAKEV